MRFCFFISILCFGLSVTAQGWRVRFNVNSSPPSTNAYYSNPSMFIFENTQGNYIAGGIAWDSIYQATCLYIMELDNQGQLLWTKKYGNFNFQYADYSGGNSHNFYVKGNYFYYTGLAVKDTSEYIGVLMKFDFNGDTLWQKTYSDTSWQVVPSSLSVSMDGGFLITGLVSSPQAIGTLLIKTDVNGNILWYRKIQKTTDPYVQYGSVVLQDSISKKVFIGGTSQKWKYNSHLQDYEIREYPQLLICDSLGNKQTETSFFSRVGSLTDLIQTKDKNFVAVGNLHDPDSLGNDWYRSMVVNFDINISQLWSIKDFDQRRLVNWFSTIYELPNGNLFLGGNLDSNLATSTRFTKLNGNNGSVLWNRYYEYSHAKANYQVNLLYVHSMMPTFDGGWVVAHTYDWQPGLKNPPFMFVKYDADGCDSTLQYCASNYTWTSVNEHEIEKVDVIVYPNPANESVNVEYKTKEGKTLRVTMRDVLGRTVYDSEMKSNTILQIPLNNIQGGVYLLNAYDGKTSVYQTKVIGIK